MTGGDGMAEWWSIEVFSGDKLPASAWRYAYEDELTEAAITNGALYYEWHDSQYGVIFEVLFPNDEQWESFRSLAAVRAALDGVPDPVNGLLIYRGRGGAAGSTKPRKPKPAPSAAALELDEPRETRRLRLMRARAKAVDELLRAPSTEPPGGPEPVGSPGEEPLPGEPTRHGAIAPAAED
jgi:hypothetical protein